MDDNPAWAAEFHTKRPGVDRAEGQGRLVLVGTLA
jgi:hypothetical protein